MLYVLSDEQVKNLQVIMADANIKGAAARAIVEIETALSQPINPKVETTDKPSGEKVKK